MSGTLVQMSGWPRPSNRPHRSDSSTARIAAGPSRPPTSRRIADGGGGRAAGSSSGSTIRCETAVAEMRLSPSRQRTEHVQRSRACPNEESTPQMLTRMFRRRRTLFHRVQGARSIGPTSPARDDAPGETRLSQIGAERFAVFRFAPHGGDHGGSDVTPPKAVSKVAPVIPASRVGCAARRKKRRRTLRRARLVSRTREGRPKLARQLASRAKHAERP